MPTSGVLFSSFLLNSSLCISSRDQDRLHGPALADRFESFGRIIERILREQGIGVYGAGSHQVQGPLVVRVIAGVAERQVDLSAYRSGGRKTYLLGVQADHTDRPARPDVLQGGAERPHRSGTLDPVVG